MEVFPEPVERPAPLQTCSFPEQETCRCSGSEHQQVVGKPGNILYLAAVWLDFESCNSGNSGNLQMEILREYQDQSQNVNKANRAVSGKRCHEVWNKLWVKSQCCVEKHLTSREVSKDSQRSALA